MFVRRRPLSPLADRGPLRVMFLITSMPIGGAETLLVNLVRRLDREHFKPSLCCLKGLGPLGEVLATEVPAFHDLINGKYDAKVLPRLVRLFRQERIDAIVTVGAGDKMFWGRIAARLAGVPVIVSAIHSTGWPDVITRLNRLRLLTRWTDAFVGVAATHGAHLTQVEGFPQHKVRVIPNGVDLRRFQPDDGSSGVRLELGIPRSAPVAAVVAALRPEKQLEQFLRTAAEVRRQVPAAEFIIVGDGPQRQSLEALTWQLGLDNAVHFLGARSDVPECLAACDAFLLTSKMEANPVSILEAMACGKPVVAPSVGSIGDAVIDGKTGFLTDPAEPAQLAARVVELFQDRQLARRLGAAGRDEAVARWSLGRMVAGYERLIAEIYTRKCDAARQPQKLPAAPEPKPESVL